MNLVSGELYWTEINEVLNKYTYLSEDIECDVLVIGAGITGALCGYYFAEAGVNTVVVDKNIIGYGSTSASTSILQYEIDQNLFGLRGLIGIDNAVKCFKLCEKTVYEIERVVGNLNDKCGFELKECLYYTYKDTDVPSLRKEYDLRKQHGFDVEFIDESNAQDMFSFPIKGGIYSRRGAAQIDPYRFAHALLQLSALKGLRVFENTEVTDIKYMSPDSIATTKNRFKIKAKKVIIAEGFESRKRIDDNILILSRSFTLVTMPLKNFKGWYNKCIIRDANKNYTYIRPTSDNRIIIGGEDIGVGGERSRISNLHNDDEAAEQKFQVLFQKLRSMFPDAEDIEVEYRFSGLFGESKDSLPYIGEYESLPGCYFNLGYGSNGILYAVFGAQFLRELYFGNRPSELELFRFNR